MTSIFGSVNIVQQLKHLLMQECRIVTRGAGIHWPGSSPTIPRVLTSPDKKHFFRLPHFCLSTTCNRQVRTLVRHPDFVLQPAAPPP
jgi:hypothetical protein